MLFNKTIVVTGASGGIGQALARRLDQAGAKLILMGRNRCQLQKLVDELGSEHELLVADLNCASGRAGALATLKAGGRSIDILVNNAGISCFSLFEQMDEQEIENIISCNLISPVLFTKSVLPLLNPQKARIVNVGSTFGSIGYPGFSVYCSSKFGLRGFSQALARELTDTNVRVQHISPRATHTAINTSKVTRLNEQLGNRMDSPEWVAQQIYRAIRKDTAVLTLGWPEKIIVPLNGLFSKLVDKVIKSQLPVIKKLAQEK